MVTSNWHPFNIVCMISLLTICVIWWQCSSNDTTPQIIEHAKGSTGRCNDESKHNGQISLWLVKCKTFSSSSTAPCRENLDILYMSRKSLHDVTLHGFQSFQDVVGQTLQICTYIYTPCCLHQLMSVLAFFWTPLSNPLLNICIGIPLASSIGIYIWKQHIACSISRVGQLKNLLFQCHLSSPH